MTGLMTSSGQVNEIKVTSLIGEGASAEKYLGGQVTSSGQVRGLTVEND